MSLWRYGWRCATVALVILSLVHTKGGVGKTTSAIYLALAAAAQGHPVRVVDADPQGSASSWADRAAHGGDPLPFDVTPTLEPDALSALRHGDPDELLIIDTPPGEGNAVIIDAAVDVADLVVIPCGVSLAEVDRVFPTLDMTEHRAVTVLLTRVDRRTNAAESMPAALRDQEVPILSSQIRHRSALSLAFGTIPPKLGDYADVYTELRRELIRLTMEGAQAS